MNKLYSFVRAKCPNCGKGNVFEKGPYSLNFIKVNKECSCCNYSFEPEPGFYYGAMYFTYAINVGIIIAMLIGFFIFTDKFNPFNYLITTVSFILLTFNGIVRLSRLLMLYLFGPPVHNNE